MKIKVLVISDYRDTIPSRPEAEIFIGLQQQGFDITIMTFPGTEYATRFRENGLNVIEFHPEKKSHKPSIQFIREKLIQGKYDIMHLFNSKASSNAIAAAKGLPVKIVLYRGYSGHIHWYDPTQYFKYLHPRVDKIFCITKDIEESIKRNSVFVPHKGVTIVKGHDLDWYKDVEPVASLEEYNIPDNMFVVMCTANARKMKGIPYLIQSTHFLPPDLPIHFLLAGRGFDKQGIQKLIAKSPYKDQIHCPGFIPDPLRVVMKASIFVMASIKGEGLNKSVIEAMSLGIPPVLTAIPGNTDLVINEESGLLVPKKDAKALAEAILRLYKNPEERKRLGKNARDQIKNNLNIKDTLSGIKQLYESLKEQ